MRFTVPKPDPNQTGDDKNPAFANVIQINMASVEEYTLNSDRNPLIDNGALNAAFVYELLFAVASKIILN